MLNEIEKYVSFTINNKFSFIDIFQFLRSSLDRSVKSLCKIDLKYLSQEFDINVLDLVKQKGFCPYEYMSDFEQFKEESPSREKFYNPLMGKKVTDKEMNMFLMLGINLKWKQRKIIATCDVLLLADVFEKFRNNTLKNYGLCPSHYLSASSSI